MNQAQVKAFIKKIVFSARKEVLDRFSGLYTSVFRGQGIEVNEVREFQYGDDVRAISWAKTAAMSRPFVKTFSEERNATVLLVVDLSGSMEFSGSFEKKKTKALEIAALLILCAMYNQDRVGMVLFSDQIEQYMPPKRGRGYALGLLNVLYTMQPRSEKTDIRAVLEYIDHMLIKRSICFILSDFLDHGFEKALQIVKRRHDVIAIYIEDAQEFVLPSGLLRFSDLETKEERIIDVGIKEKENFEKKRKEACDDNKSIFKKIGVDTITVATEEPYIPKMLAFFRMRKERR